MAHLRIGTATPPTGRRAGFVAIAALMMLVSACGWIAVSAPRTAGLGCTRSAFLPYFDLALAIGGAIALSKTGLADNEPSTMAAPALFAATGLWGRYKVHQCRVRWDHASPEEIAQYNQAVADYNAGVAAAQAEQARQQQLAYEQQLAYQQQLAAQQPQQPVPDPGDAPDPGYTPDPGYAPDPGYTPPPPMGGNPTITIERHASTDELGKRCQAQRGTWPSAQTCQYGSVCYGNQCTVWCGNEGQCPAGYTCAMTDEAPFTKLCRR